MELDMNATMVRTACVLALSTGTGCADIYFTYAEDALLPVPIQDIGSECETDDPVDTEMARAHVEQDGDTCVITADVLVRAIEYQDVVDSLDGINVEEAEWLDGGICWGEATEGDGTLPHEKCDYGPSIAATWRLVGEEAWLPDPEFPPQATADLAVSYYPGPLDTLDDIDERDPAMVFSTNGANFPGGVVSFDHPEFFDAFETAVPDDLYSVVHARVEVPMTDIAAFAEHEYQMEFAYQMYVQGLIEGAPLFDGLFDWLFGPEEE
jgi:hypothetical protein